MKKHSLIIFLLLSVPVFSQIQLKMYVEKTANGYVVYADNNEFCPISVQLNLTLKNMRSTQGNNTVFLIPAKTKKHTITTLIPINKIEKYGYSYKNNYTYGNVKQTDFEKDYPYYLPYAKNTSYTVSQGYNGKLSHQNKNALDFTMPIGTKIHASRKGVVVKVVEHNFKTCDTSECAKYNNYILVYHTDGTFAEYTHIKQDGALVTKGAQIKKGQEIAESGNVGWSTGPHLHFVVFLQKMHKRVTLKTAFKVNNTLVYLEEKQKYTQEYD